MVYPDKAQRYYRLPSYGLLLGKQAVYKTIRAQRGGFIRLYSVVIVQGQGLPSVRLMYIINNKLLYAYSVV